jgi:uncharacterized protein (DUF362 family)
LKTHVPTRFTGAVKNLYGTISAGLLTDLHGDHAKLEEFSHALLDIFSLTRPALTVMDAVVGMEGADPANGTPRNIGLVITDAVAVDAMAQMIIGLDPLEVGTTYSTHIRVLGIPRRSMSWGDRLRERGGFPASACPRGAPETPPPRSSADPLDTIRSNR